MMLETAVSIGVGLTCGNFTWQLISRKRNWGEAVAFSFMQLIAVALCFGFSQK